MILTTKEVFVISASIRFEGPSFFNIALQPYAEAGKHFKKALVCSEGPSLLGRVGHVGAGLFLMIPIINNIFMAIILIGFKPREGQNLLYLLGQLRDECPETTDPQVLIDYFCPRSLFPEELQPQLEHLNKINRKEAWVEDSSDGDLANGHTKIFEKETYLLMQLCEALYNIMGDEEEGTKKQLCRAFIRLGDGWIYGTQERNTTQKINWEDHAGTLHIPLDTPFIEAVRAQSRCSF